jgi:phospholipid/cholesterol/gamma-HCH transport system substrate-binding protein
MPPPSKTSWAQLRVGILAVAALLLLFVLVFYITSSRSLFAKEERIVAYFDVATGIAKGSPVRLNGLNIGNVSSVGFSGEAARGRFIRVEMTVAAQYLPLIPADSRVSVGSENLLGSRLIDIVKGNAPAPVAPGGELAADTTTELEDLLQQGRTTLGAAELILRRLEAIVSQVELGKGSIGRLLKDDELYNRLNAIAGEVQKSAHAINSSGGTIGKLIYDDKLYQDLDKLLVRFDAIAASVQAGEGTAGKLMKDPALYEETRRTIASLRTTIDNLNAGKGTAGKLLTDEKLHTELTAAVASLNALLNNLNQGKGTMGQLLVNEQLYENLNGVSMELTGLLKDFRADPKKFLRIKLGLF